MAEQIRQALHDGETEAKAAAALAGGIVELVELLENPLKLAFLDTGTGVPDLDAQLVAAPPAAEQHLALRGIFHRVRQQVAQHLLEQAGIAVHGEAARDDAPAEALRFRVIDELGPQPLEQIVDREADRLGADDAGLELVDVEERVQHARHGAQRLVEPGHQLQGALILDLARQQPLQQADGLQRLTQIVARGGEEARLADIGLLGLALGRFDRFRRAVALGDIVDRQQDLRPFRETRRGILRALRQQRPFAEQRQIELDLAILDQRAARPEPDRGSRATLEYRRDWSRLSASGWPTVFPGASAKVS